METADGESMLLEKAAGLRSDLTGLNRGSTALTARKLHTIGTSGIGGKRDSVKIGSVANSRSGNCVNLSSACSSRLSRACPASAGHDALRLHRRVSVSRRLRRIVSEGVSETRRI